MSNVFVVDYREWGFYDFVQESMTQVNREVCIVLGFYVSIFVKFRTEICILFTSLVGSDSWYFYITMCEHFSCDGTIIGGY